MNRRKIRFQLSLTEFIYNGCFAAANFLSVFLESIGFSAGQIGLTMSLISGIGIASQPTWGIVSDKMRSMRRCFMLCMLGTAACALGVAFLSGGAGIGQGWIVGALALLYFFFHPSNMMMELWLVRISAHPRLRIPYGAMRSWASIGYALFSLVFVPLLRLFPERSIYFFLAGFALLALLLAGKVPGEAENDGEPAGRQRLRDQPFRAVLNYWVLAYVLFEALYQIPINWRATYMIYVLQEFGTESRLYGALMFMAGLCEVPMLLLTHRLTARAGWAWPLIISVLILMVEYGFYAWGHSLALLFTAQLLRGSAYALYVACRYQYVHRLAPKGLEGSTMAVVNAVSAVTNFLAAAAGGFLLEKLGTRPFYAMLCGLQFFSGLFFVGSHLIGSRALNKSLPDAQCSLFL